MLEPNPSWWELNTKSSCIVFIAPEPFQDHWNRMHLLLWMEPLLEPNPHNSFLSFFIFFTLNSLSPSSSLTSTSLIFIFNLHSPSSLDKKTYKSKTLTYDKRWWHFTKRFRAKRTFDSESAQIFTTQRDTQNLYISQIFTNPFSLIPLYEHVANHLSQISVNSNST